MKRVTTIAIFGLSLIILIYLYYLLTDYRVVRPIDHSEKMIEFLRFIGFAAMLPFFLKFRKRKLVG